MRWPWLVVTACFSPAPPAGSPCASGQACPTGLVCLAGVCTTGAAIDAEVIADTGSDGAPATDCWPAWRAGIPQMSQAVLIAELATSDDERDPFLGPDGGSIVFARGVANAHDLFFAVRASRTLPFSNPQALGTINSQADETKASVTADGLTAIFASGRAGGVGENDLWTATRASPGAAFGNVTEMPVALLETTNQELDPIVSGDGSVLYFSELASPAQSIQRSTLGNGVYGKPTTVPIQGAVARVADPCPSPDETVLLYTGFDATTNQSDLYLAIKSGVAGTGFVAQGKLPVSTGGNDGDATITADGCDLVFSSQTQGQFDLYETTVMP